jgi:hypothetical protein
MMLLKTELYYSANVHKDWDQKAVWVYLNS